MENFCFSGLWIVILDICTTEVKEMWLHRLGVIGLLY
nr:MAG TPA: hypothetical protein [Caudoviricetes sp.]DAV60079.1 MAG TPA: hypothetical protein [Caudoviricetes sp.]